MDKSLNCWYVTGTSDCPWRFQISWAVCSLVSVLLSMTKLYYGGVQSLVRYCYCIRLCHYWLQLLLSLPAPTVSAAFLYHTISLVHLTSLPYVSFVVFTSLYIYPLPTSSPGVVLCPPEILPDLPPANLHRLSLRPAPHSCLYRHIMSLFAAPLLPSAFTQVSIGP